LEIHLYNGSYQTLAKEIEASGIEFVERHQFSVSSAQVVLELAEILKTPYPWASLSVVLVAWLKAKANRKITVIGKDGRVIDTHGMAASEIVCILEKTSSVSAYESNDQEQL
jgi:hypothetical protein